MRRLRAVQHLFRGPTQKIVHDGLVARDLVRVGRHVAGDRQAAERRQPHLGSGGGVLDDRHGTLVRRPGLPRVGRGDAGVHRRFQLGLGVLGGREVGAQVPLQVPDVFRRGRDRVPIRQLGRRVGGDLGLRGGTHDALRLLDLQLLQLSRGVPAAGSGAPGTGLGRRCQLSQGIATDRGIVPLPRRQVGAGQQLGEALRPGAGLDVRQRRQRDLGNGRGRRRQELVDGRQSGLAIDRLRGGRRHRSGGGGV